MCWACRRDTIARILGEVTLCGGTVNLGLVKPYTVEQKNYPKQGWFCFVSICCMCAPQVSGSKALAPNLTIQT